MMLFFIWLPFSHAKSPAAGYAIAMRQVEITKSSVCGSRCKSKSRMMDGFGRQRSAESPFAKTLHIEKKTPGNHRKSKSIIRATRFQPGIAFWSIFI
jgi:hypothetical protein